MKFFFAVVLVAMAQYAVVYCADTRYERSVEMALQRVRRRVPGSIDNYLKTVLNNFKAEMASGIPSLKIPPLDPFKIKDQKLVVKDSKNDITAFFKNNNVRGLSGFQIKKLRLDLNRLTFEFSLKIPKIQATGDYSVKDGIAFKFFPVYGNGKYSVTVKNLIVSAKVKVTIDSNGKGTLAEPPHLAVQFSDVDLYLQNFLGGLSSIVNRVLNILAKPIFMKFEPKLIESLKKALFKVLNKQLSKIDIGDFL